MKEIISCDCFEEIRKETEKKVGYPLYGIERIVCIPIFEDKKEEKTLINVNDMVLPNITNCPFCGKKIEVSE